MCTKIQGKSNIPYFFEQFFSLARRVVVYNTRTRTHCLNKALAVIGLRDAVRRLVPRTANHDVDLEGLRSMIAEDKKVQ